MATIQITRTYEADFAEHTVTAGGDPIATAHRAGTKWSVKTGSKLIGIAPTEAIAIRTLGQIAESFARNLREAGLDVRVDC